MKIFLGLILCFTVQVIFLENSFALEDLLESTYELEIKLGYVIKWFAVRIEPD